MQAAKTQVKSRRIAALNCAWSTLLGGFASIGGCTDPPPAWTSASADVGSAEILDGNDVATDAATAIDTPAETNTPCTTYAQVQPVFAQTCVPCHAYEKECGPAKKIAKAIASTVKTGFMPPKGSLMPTPEQRQALIQWHASAAPCEPSECKQ